MLRFFNTLSRKKEDFKPIKKGHVGLYSCGPTVYNYAHIGNLRSFIFVDQLKRYLEFKGFKVKHIMNFTDVDDKTIKGAREQGIPLAQYTEKYKKAFVEDLKTLNIEPPAKFTPATEFIPQMVEMVKKLLEKGLAYKGEDGSIYFAVSKFKGYGKLSKLKLKELKTGSRVKQDEYSKEQANDFALWKAWSEEDGEVFWETEIGKGRPGWHIECSAMSSTELGLPFDIHTGGVDLIFPHHENEIAQSEGATGKKFVNYWLHSAHLVVEGKKMSKSQGNYFTLRDLLEKGFSPKALRYLLLSTHYKSELNFTEQGAGDAEKTIERFREFLQKLEAVKESSGEGKAKKLSKKAEKGFMEAMDNDLSITEALAALFDFMREVNKLLDQNALSEKEAETVLEQMKRFDKVLGLLDFEEEKISAEAMELIRKREQLRKEKRFQEADGVREKLKGMGILLDDTAEGTKWKKVKEIL